MVYRMVPGTKPPCGKTRLALAAAADLVDGFEDGVWWADLAPLADPALVPQASALEVREVPGRPLTEALANYLRPRRLLLVLDNCEHLAAAYAALADAVLRACPNVRILVTSREALRITGETIWLVSPQSFPDPRHLPAVESLTQYEAVRLFAERAAAVLPSFKLTRQSAPAVARVCQRLDGIPQAIELAAARVSVLSLEQIAERLGECFGLLTAGSRTALPRHQTLRATMEWSHDLLAERERVLFRRLSVFAGGFGLGALEAVCAGGGIEKADVFDLLSLLVDKSLVAVEERERGEARYRLLETVRQYGWEKLREAGEVDAIRQHHANFFFALAEEAAPELKGPQ